MVVLACLVSIGLALLSLAAPSLGAGSVLRRTGSVSTPIGTATGASDVTGVNRFVVRYATASRWADSSVATSWDLPNNLTDASALPLACPQTDIDSSEYSEDCLSMILYVPTSLTTSSNVPTFMWIHGGSFVIGSATDPGLDGSNLALATNSIVAVIQYRLGALGYMAPDGTTNLAVKDVINALKFLQNVIPSFGGDASKITVAGQSSGANMIRVLLAAPSAASLFQYAIIQSDPMNYGFLSTSIQSTLQTYFNELLSCNSSDSSCLDSLSVDTILNAQTTLSDDASTLAAGAGSAEPIRPVRDNSLITSPLDSTDTFPSVNKNILISNVKNEAGATIYGTFDFVVTESLWDPICEASLGDNRTETIDNSGMYNLTALSDGVLDLRMQLEELGTDYMWKCSGWTFSREWVQNGGTAYVGMYTVGASYPGNSAIAFCIEEGVVCHQDDIMIVFGTVDNPTSEQSALITEMQARYKAFMNTGNPNVDGSNYTTWTASTDDNVNAINLGGTADIPIGACTPAFWGEEVQYDYQFYDI